MKFELNPTLVLTPEELNALNTAHKLCKDMDNATTYMYDGSGCVEEPSGCEICPKRTTCSQMAHECVFVIAHNTLKKII